MLTSNSVKGCRLKSTDRMEMRGAKAKGGVSNGYVDPSVVTVPGRKLKLNSAGRRRAKQRAMRRAS